jgi:crotonyl-CoA carboxylase/reductase
VGAPHRRLRRLRRRLKVGDGVTKWKPGDEVVIHCNQASYEDVDVHGLDPLAAPSQQIWGYETTWGSFAQFTRSRPSSSCPSRPTSPGSSRRRTGLTYFTAYRMLMDRCRIQAGHNVLIWGAAGGLGVFATQLCAAAGANAVGVVSSDEKGELVKKLGAVDFINRDEFAGMMRQGGESPEEEKARFKVSAASPSGSRRSWATPRTSSSSTSARRRSRPPCWS